MCETPGETRASATGADPEPYTMMSDPDRDRPGHRPADDELVAIPRIADHIGVTPRVVRYWEEQGLISPTQEHGKLRYSPRDVAIARLTKLLLDAGVGIEGIRMLKGLSDRDIRRAIERADATELAEVALRILYQRKAFREATGMDEEHYPEGRPPPPAHGPGHKRHGPGPKQHGPGPKDHHPR